MKNLAMHLMDILQNSIRAGAENIGIELSEDCRANILQVTLLDDGHGMTPEQLSHASDPFFTTRTTRRVGLGLSLLKQRAEETGGWLCLQSEEGAGTRITAQFVRDHIDRPVWGDIAGTIALAITANPSIRFTYSHCVDEKRYSIGTAEIKAALGAVPIDEPVVHGLVKELIRENLLDLGIDFNA